MIINLLINVILAIFAGIFSFLPPVTIASIPIIGGPASTALLAMVKTWNALLSTVPYLEHLWDIFLFVILPFEGLLLIAKFFMGNRTPAHIH